MSKCHAVCHPCSKLSLSSPNEVPACTALTSLQSPFSVPPLPLPSCSARSHHQHSAQMGFQDISFSSSRQRHSAKTNWPVVDSPPLLGVFLYPVEPQSRPVIAPVRSTTSLRTVKPTCCL